MDTQFYGVRLSKLHEHSYTNIRNGLSKLREHSYESCGNGRGANINGEDGDSLDINDCDTEL